MSTQPRHAYRILVVALLAGLVGCAHPPRHGGGRPASPPAVQVIFTDQDRLLIQDYYARSLPPGLAKQGKIPPGHAKKLMRGAGVPSGQGWRDLPGDLERRLTPLPAGYIRVVIGNDVAIMEVAAQRVVDLLEDVAN